MSAPLFDDVCRGFFAPKPDQPRLPFANSHLYNSDPRFAPKVPPQLSNTFPSAPVKPRSYRSRTDCDQGVCSMGDFGRNPGSVDLGPCLSPRRDSALTPVAHGLKREQDQLERMYMDGVMGGTIARTTQPGSMCSPPRSRVYSTPPSLAVGDKRRDAGSPSFCDRYGYGDHSMGTHMSVRRRL